jgi:hypothetical protein
MAYPADTNNPTIVADMFLRAHLWMLLLIAFLAFLVIIEIGFRIGMRHQARHEAENAETAKIHVGALQAALLILLALLLGFTFAMAVARFDARKSLVVDEANAIGTAYLRSQLLPPPHREDAARLLREYVGARIEFHEAGIDKVRFDSANDATARLQQQIWTLGGVVAAQDTRSVPTGLFIGALNAMIDVSETHRVALENRVPQIVTHLLFAVSAAALGFIAYGSGITGRRRLISTGIFALLIAVVLTVILDVDRSHRGLIVVGHDSMLRLQVALQEKAR